MNQELAIVSGGAGAIGQVIVRALRARGLGVVAVGRRASELAALAAADPGIRPCVADLASDDAIAPVRAALTAPVRALVHSVGVPVAGGVLEAGTDALLDAVNVKLCGLLRLVRAADGFLVRHSRIIAIGGHYGLEPTAYAATAGVSNAALINLSRQLSLAYGPRGITAHVIAPGPADTERLRAVAAARAAQRGVGMAEILDELRAESSLGAFTTPEQVAWGVTMLLSPEADAMTGSTLMLDSGRRRGLP
ncbi:SDR family NAD(P)-dependent oxidoreductase [Acidocella sp.]|uniref:SDR family NAD(P)-dependent oxidoreductase n=1 Tax=Acidocella sp. TaxID=50710 RepID=UPI002636457B|nr:SDR family oxidoreductase [Acidocella sp.]